MGFKDKLKAAASKIKEFAEEVSEADAEKRAGASSLPKRVSNCPHCRNTGYCFACHGSGELHGTQCVHCKGKGLCNCCGGGRRV